MKGGSHEKFLLRLAKENHIPVWKGEDQAVKKGKPDTVPLSANANTPEFLFCVAASHRSEYASGLDLFATRWTHDSFHPVTLILHMVMRFSYQRERIRGFLVSG